MSDFKFPTNIGELNLNEFFNDKQNDLYKYQYTFSSILEKMSNNETVIIDGWGDSTYAQQSGQPLTTLQETLRIYYNNNNIIVNKKGLGGDGTTNRLKTWENDMKLSNADIVFMNYCINDAKGSADGTTNPKIDGKTYQDNLRKMVKIAREYNKIVILDTPNPATHNNSIGTFVVENVKQFANIMRNVALEFSCFYVDNYVLFERLFSKPRNKIQDFLSDGYHPNLNGYKIKGLNMSAILIHPSIPIVNCPMIINALYSGTRANGTNERTVSSPTSRAGFGKLVSNTSSIRIPIFIDQIGLDLYIATPKYNIGSSSISILVNNVLITDTLNIYDPLANYFLDQEILIMENLNPGFYLVEIKNNLNTDNIGIYYLRTRNTRFNDIKYRIISGSLPQLNPYNQILSNIRLKDNATTTITLFDEPTSILIKDLNIEVKAIFKKRQGSVLFANNTRDDKIWGGLYFFLNDEGKLRISEGDYDDDYVNATTIGAVDLSDNYHIYNVNVTTNKLCTFYVDDVEIGTYTLTKNNIGGFFGLFDMLNENRDLIVDYVKIN
jgi:lysophospholipase L1-like esterase